MVGSGGVLKQVAFLEQNRGSTAVTATRTVEVVLYTVNTSQPTTYPLNVVAGLHKTTRWRVTT